MDELTPNMQAYLDLVNDINHLFIGLEYDEPCDICDGDMKLLDKAVKRFKSRVWENQLTQWHNTSLEFTPRDYNKVYQTFFPIMKKVNKSAKDLRLSIILDKLCDLGWEYTCNCMTRSGMQTYDELMQYVGALEPNEHWNEDAYKDKCCDH